MDTIIPELKKFPTIGIFVRHSVNCPAAGSHAGGGDEQYRRCRCWKWLRWREHGKLHREPTNCRDWTGAEREKQKLLKKWEAAAYGLPLTARTNISVAEAGKLHIADKEQQGLQPVSIGKIKRTINALVMFCEQHNIMLLNAISPEDLIQYRTSWTHLKTLDSRKNEQTRLKSFFHWCVTSELLMKNPALKLGAIKGKRKATMPFEPEQMTAILAAIPESLTPYGAQRVRALVRLMRWTGLSLRDAVTLAKDELQLVGREYHVVQRRIKTKVLIDNIIPTDVAEELLALRNSNKGYFFWSGMGTQKSAAGLFDKMLRTVFEKAEIPDGTSHRLRDTAAVELLKHGVDIRDVSKFLGHSSLKTTEKYYAPWNKAQQKIFDSKIKSAQRMMRTSGAD